MAPVYACQDLREVLTIGEAMNVDLAQMDQLRKVVDQRAWTEAVAHIEAGGKYTTQEAARLIDQAGGVGCAQPAQVEMLKAKHEAAVQVTDKVETTHYGPTLQAHHAAMLWPFEFAAHMSSFIPSRAANENGCPFLVAM
eukprot:scaffold142022_cov38-Prasinocladus_malaysianus.AAC.1